jgi:hypothetical protein
MTMSITTADHVLQEGAPFEIRFDWLPRVPRRVWAALSAATLLMAASHVNLALQSPAQAIKTALTNAATEMMSPSGPQPSAAALDTIQHHFGNQPATIDARYWPQLAVTVQGVDKTACIEATTIASRLEGLVVVQLEKYRSVAECGESNNMTWWILP